MFHHTMLRCRQRHRWVRKICFAHQRKISVVGVGLFGWLVMTGLRGAVFVVNLAFRKRELVYWVVLCSDPTVVPTVVW